ncbi:protein LEAD-SENSITIVE 1-like [Rhodamnia argentea]|uniref:Protein LEAD-SENSITIVE 1-like n=1 Tax=Rhodamnia argentea TaxID=178133 RepID=A0ABM3HC42_9MYRT|nr:protein LEAD-SENSITIVE 1-like [Rhodamnia argentea]
MGKAVTLEDLNAGDHIFRYGLHGMYSHHGIYVGNGYVIHFTRTENKKNICQSLSKTSPKQRSCPDFPKCENQETVKLGVVKTCLDCFRRDGNKLRSLHCYGYGGPRLWFMLARPGTCTTLPCTKSRDQVIEKATKLHADNAFGDYSMISNNCEHFAVFCRTNIRRSE